MSEPDVEQAKAAASRVDDWDGADHYEDCPALQHIYAECGCGDTDPEQDACAALSESQCDCYLGAMRECRTAIRALLASHERLRRKLPCGHPASLDDSYGGCVLCLTLQSHAEGEVYEDRLEAEVERLRQLLARVHEAIGEAPESADDSLPDVVTKIIRELRQRVAELEGLGVEDYSHPEPPSLPSIKRLRR